MYRLKPMIIKPVKCKGIHLICKFNKPQNGNYIVNKSAVWAKLFYKQPFALMTTHDYTKNDKMTQKNTSFEVFVNNTNLTFLPFLYKITVEVS